MRVLPWDARPPSTEIASGTFIPNKSYPRLKTKVQYYLYRYSSDAQGETWKCQTKAQEMY